MKTRIFLMAFMLLVSCTAITQQASAKELTKEQTEARIAQIKDRVDEIKSMDFSHLNNAERKDMRKELKGMNKELRGMEPYIYTLRRGIDTDYYPDTHPAIILLTYQ